MSIFVACALHILSIDLLHFAGKNTYCQHSELRTIFVHPVIKSFNFCFCHSLEVIQTGVQPRSAHSFSTSLSFPRLAVHPTVFVSFRSRSGCRSAELIDDSDTASGASTTGFFVIQKRHANRNSSTNASYGVIWGRRQKRKHNKLLLQFGVVGKKAKISEMHAIFSPISRAAGDTSAEKK